MRIAIIWFAIAGVLLGGAFAFARQKKPIWAVLLLVALAGFVAWFGWLNWQAVQ
ncbi:hypothetical protein [Solicola sp. PLA-1-18]|uniref:hypothetical protein n=1 Tax=Solicola sp. PLA-1-18 TaxID=3380532 RepID=UPI003B81A702